MNLENSPLQIIIVTTNDSLENIADIFKKRKRNKYIKRTLKNIEKMSDEEISLIAASVDFLSVDFFDYFLPEFFSQWYNC